MPKFTVRMIYTAVTEADSKETILAEAKEVFLNNSVHVPEIIVTRYKAPKSVPVDKRTGSLFTEETV